MKDNLKICNIGKIPQLKILGRNVSRKKDTDEPLALFWGASGIEVKFKGTELWAEIEAGYDCYEPWVCVLVNGAKVSRFAADEGKRWVCLCRGFQKDSVKTVRLLKDTQPMPSDENHRLLVHALAIPCDGEFLPVDNREMNIEFIGDSITSGEGLCGATSEAEWISTWISASESYAFKVAQELNADFRILSQCGWGITCGWDNNIRTALPLYYEQVCGIAHGEVQARLGAGETYDFASWKADVVVVNLGTNDSGAFSNPAWTDPTDGKVYKMRSDESGVPLEEDGNKVSAGVRSFLKAIRKNNPTARIIWAWGMIQMTALAPYIKKGISDYKAETGDENISTLELEPMDKCETRPEDKGSRGHPGPATHAAAAKRIVEAIRAARS